MARILLVDDEESIRSSLAPYLQRSGHEVAAAADGVLALEAVASWQPDLLVCDGQLACSPEGHGVLKLGGPVRRWRAWIGRPDSK